MVFYDWGLELSEFLSMCLTFNSTEVFTCLKYLNTMMNCEQAMKKTIKCTYVINTLKLISISCSIHFLCSCNYQRLQLYSDFLMLIVRPNDLNLPPLLSSLSFPRDRQICPVSHCAKPAIYLETPMLTSPVLWNTWENTWLRIKGEVLAPLQCFREVNHDRGKRYHNTLTRTPV